MNANATQQIANKAWGFAHVLRDDRDLLRAGRQGECAFLRRKAEQFAAIAAELKR